MFWGVSEASQEESQQDGDRIKMRQGKRKHTGSPVKTHMIWGSWQQSVDRECGQLAWAQGPCDLLREPRDRSRLSSSVEVGGRHPLRPSRILGSTPRSAGVGPTGGSPWDMHSPWQPCTTTGVGPG